VINLIYYIIYKIFYSLRSQYFAKFAKSSKRRFSIERRLRQKILFDSFCTVSLQKLDDKIDADFVHLTQARNQLGTPGGAKSFLRGAQIFLTMSNSFKLCPTHLSREGEKFSRGVSPPGYGPDLT